MPAKNVNRITLDLKAKLMKLEEPFLEAIKQVTSNSDTCRLVDCYMFLGNCPPTPPLSQHLYFSLKAKCWIRGEVGGQFPRNL